MFLSWQTEVSADIFAWSRGALGVPSFPECLSVQIWCLCAARDTKAHNLTCTHCTATMMNFVVATLLLNHLDC